MELDSEPTIDDYNLISIFFLMWESRSGISSFSGHLMPLFNSNSTDFLHVTIYIDGAL